MRTVNAAEIALVMAIFFPMSALADMAAGVSIGSARVDGGNFNGSDFGYKAHVGYYGPLLGAELNYVNFGRFESNGPEAEAWAPALTLGMPLGGIAFHGKVGIAFPEVRGSSFAQEFEKRDVFYGIGLRVGANSFLGVRIEYERFHLGDATEDLASAGLEFLF